MPRFFGFGMFASVLIVTGCSDTPAPAAPTPVASGCVFAKLTEPARVFAFADAPTPVLASTRCTRVVLFDSGTFEFDGGPNPFFGLYRVHDTILDLTWLGASTAGPWESNATLDADTLTIDFGSIMELSGFEDAVYRRVS